MKKNSVFIGVGLLALAISGVAQAGDVVVDISGTQSWEFQGDPLNETILVTGFNVGDVITGVSWDVVLTTFSPSWADEPRINVNDGNTISNTFGVLGPFGSATTTTSGNFVGSLPLAYTMTDTSILLEFYETGFNDFSGAPDAIFLDGSFLTIHVESAPAPGALALAGMAGLLGRRRRRSA